MLEAGCGVGPQTVTLASNSPEARIVAIDVSAASLGIRQPRDVADQHLGRRVPIDFV